MHHMAFAYGRLLQHRARANAEGVTAPRSVIYGLFALAAAFGTFESGSRALAAEPWPAESRAAALDIGAPLMGGEPSGAAWHEGLERLFIVDDRGRVVHMNGDGSDPMAIESLPSDIEAAFALPGDDDHIYVGLENPPTLLRVVIATGATAGSWVFPGMSVGSADERLESLAFLPNAFTAAIRTTEDAPYNDGNGSVFATGGLVLAGHQGNGRIYLYDIDLTLSDAPLLVNTYGPFDDAGDTLLDLADLDFHAPTGMLYALWDSPVAGKERGRLGLLDPATQFSVVTVWKTAADSFGEEGFALLDSGMGSGLARAVIAEDDASDHSVYLYSLFSVPGAQTTTTTTTSTTSTTTPPGLPSCADPSGDLAITATDALRVLRAAVGALSCLLCYCDVDGSGVTTAVDALRTLGIAVGQPHELLCPACTGQ